MDDCGAVLHNIETKWLYDFLTLEKCRNFSRAAVSRNVSQPAFSRRIRALEQAIGVELFNRRDAAATLGTRENLSFADPPSVATVRKQPRQSCVAAAITRNVKSRLPLHTLFSVCYRPLSARCRRSLRAIEAIDVDEAVDKLREGQSDCIFPFTTKICWKRRLTTFAYLNLNCSPSAQVTNTEKHCLTSRSHTFRY